MRLDVAHVGAGGGGQAFQRANLVDDVGHQVGAGHVHVASAETRQVGVGHMRAHRHAIGARGLQGAQDAGRIARMETAGHVGAGHHRQHGLVIAHAPGAKAFAQVTV
ncbi:hypothetical protein D3C87_1463150 [compost metagenome]